MTTQPDPAAGLRYETPADPGYRRLERSRDERWLGGVCGGLAERYDLDPAGVRIVVAVLVLLGLGSVAIVYLLAWIVVPLEPSARY